MIRTWFILSLLGGIFQLLLGSRCSKQWVGIWIPVLFSIFAVYACLDLSQIGIDFSVLFCFWLPPIFQLLLFEFSFWKKQFETVKK